MKTLDPQFQVALESEQTAIAWCWLIEPKQGAALGFTSFDVMFSIYGTQYQPFTGFTPTADSNSEGLENNNSQDLEGLFTSDQISAQDIMSGKLDDARVTCFQVDVTNLPLNLTDTPTKFLPVYQRYIKSFTANEIGFKIGLRDDDWLLEADIGKVTSKFCDYDLGEPRCGVDLTPYTFTQNITAITSRYQFTLSGSFTEGQFNRGKITFITGNNAGVTRDVATNDSGNQVTLWQPMPYSISVGDEVSMVQGCGKTLYDCITRYDNAIKFDGEPHIPSSDRAFNLPIDG